MSASIPARANDAIEDRSVANKPIHLRSRLIKSKWRADYVLAAIDTTWVRRKRRVAPLAPRARPPLLTFRRRYFKSCPASETRAPPEPNLPAPRRPEMTRPTRFSELMATSTHEFSAAPSVTSTLSPSPRFLVYIRAASYRRRITSVFPF